MFETPDELTTRDLIGLGILAVIEEIHHLHRRIDHMALDLTTLTADVQANTDAAAAASTLLDTLAQEIRDNQNNPAALDALAAQIEANNTKLSQAVATDTGPGPSTLGSGPAPSPHPNPTDINPDQPAASNPAPAADPAVIDPTNHNNDPVLTDPAQPLSPPATGTEPGADAVVPETVPPADVPSS